MPHRFFDIPGRAWFAALALAMFGLVAFSLALQSSLRLAPCPFCIFQRVLYLAIGCCGLLGLAWPALRAAWASAIAALALGGIAVAGYQSWMQAFPHLATECGYAEPNLIERLVDWLGMQWPSLFLATGFCTSREWEMFGLSMANWSVLLFAGTLVFAGLLLRSRG
jgi:disulfide bond formation protein DsbB